MGVAQGHRAAGLHSPVMELTGKYRDIEIGIEQLTQLQAIVVKCLLLDSTQLVII